MKSWNILSVSENNGGREWKKKIWNVFIAIERKQIYVSLFLGLEIHFN